MSARTPRSARKNPPSITRVSIPSAAASSANGPPRKHTSVTSMLRERFCSSECTWVFAPPVSPPLIRCMTFKLQTPACLFLIFIVK